MLSTSPAENLRKPSSIAFRASCSSRAARISGSATTLIRSTIGAMGTAFDPLFDQITAADTGIRPQVPVTPLERSRGLSAALGCEVLLKCEHLQPTGSFKVRGAANKIRLLDAAARRAGVITASTGNHGQGVARAGKLAGVAVTVYVAHSEAPQRMDAVRALGAEG